MENQKVNNIDTDTDNKEGKCEDCLYRRSCEKQLHNEIHMSDTAVGIDNELYEMDNCKGYYPTDENEIETEVTYDRSEYGIEYNTYLYEFENC